MIARRAVLALCLLLGSAHANGRLPNVQSIDFRPGSTQDIVAGTTFGVLVSHDNGQTWRWMCENAVGYGGTYDPDYSYVATGSIFATAFDAARVNRDGCTFEDTGLGSAYASQIESTSDRTLVALSDPSAATIDTTLDDGLTFPTVASPGIDGDWWQSLAIAASDSQRVYLVGFRIVNGARVPLLYTSTDGGTTFDAMSATGLSLADASTISIVGISPTTPTTVYASIYPEPSNTFGIYRSTDAGGSWTRITGAANPVAFLTRANGDLVTGSTTIAQVSHDSGQTWTPLAGAPPITCLVERVDGVVWACTRTATANAYHIQTSTDLATWTGVLRFEDIAGPVTCGAGTTQHDTCEPLYCALRMQLGITGDPTGCDPIDGAIDGVTDAAPESPVDAAVQPTHAGGGGCCETSTGGGLSTLALAFLVALVVRRRSRP